MDRIRKLAFGESLLEKLSEKRELPHTQTASLQFLKEVIRRDLEALLNTRKTMTRELEGYPQAVGTVLSYGLEEFGALHGSPDLHSHKMKQAIQECLTEFEPRLLDVVVSVLGSSREKREIRLHIEAKLPVYPSAETVCFDTVFDVAKEMYSVA